MQVAIISTLSIALCILFICLSGCIDEYRAHGSDPGESAGEKNTSPAVNESSFVMTSDGIPLRYEIHGQGPPVVFVLGYGMTLDEWPHRMIDTIARSHTVIVYNHRGISGVHNPAVPFTIRQGAEDLHDVILQLAGGDDRCGEVGDGINSDGTVKPGTAQCSPLPVDIVGYSMGGMIAQEFAQQYPGSLHHLVLISTDCGGAERVPAADWVLEELGRTPNSPEEALERAGRLLLTESYRTGHPDPRTWFEDYGEIADPGAVQQQYDAFTTWEGVYADLPAIRSRTLVVSGDQDRVIPPENGEIIANAIPNATLVIREGEGHGMIFVVPEEIAGIIEKFLR